MNTTADAPKKLLTFSSGGWVILLASFFVLVAAGIVLWPLYQTGFHRAVGDGRHVDSYGFDLSHLTIPRESLIASGKAKDDVRAIPQALVETATPREIEMMNKNEHTHFIIPPDRVIGVSINGESRAYPVRILNLHEVVNDTVGGVPIAVTWSSLCDSAVVFDRRIHGIGGDVAEFGVSGLLVNSNPVFFDRAAAAKDESLWLQLSFRAIAGPAAVSGKKLTLVPFELTTWKAWLDAHSSTRVLLGLRTLKAVYENHQTAYDQAQDPFNLYLATDELLFPVDPTWKQPGVMRKTRIVATSADNGEHWKAALPGTSPPGARGEQRVYAFVFAWYAQHPTDTDYSAIK